MSSLLPNLFQAQMLLEQLHPLTIELVSILLTPIYHTSGTWLTCLSFRLASCSCAFCPFPILAGMIPYANQAHAPAPSAAAIYAHHNVVATFDYLPWLNPEKELLVSAPARTKSVTATPPPATSAPSIQSEATLDPQLLEELSRSDDIKVE
jgi:hypothetical protein